MRDGASGRFGVQAWARAIRPASGPWLSDLIVKDLCATPVVLITQGPLLGGATSRVVPLAVGPGAIRLSVPDTVMASSLTVMSVTVYHGPTQTGPWTMLAGGTFVGGTATQKNGRVNLWQLGWENDQSGQWVYIDVSSATSVSCECSLTD